MTLVLSHTRHAVSLFDCQSKLACGLSLLPRDLVVVLLERAGCRSTEWLTANTVVENSNVAWRHGPVLHHCVLLLSLIYNVLRGHPDQLRSLRPGIYHGTDHLWEVGIFREGVVDVRVVWNQVLERGDGPQVLGS